MGCSSCSTKEIPNINILYSDIVETNNDFDINNEEYQRYKKFIKNWRLEEIQKNSVLPRETEEFLQLYQESYPKYFERIIQIEEFKKVLYKKLSLIYKLRCTPLGISLINIRD
ncbi:MAG: hypothetical protein MJ252_09660, partial [archaeon]|nr:hypothetical protein [archaeon]